MRTRRVTRGAAHFVRLPRATSKPAFVGFGMAFSHPPVRRTLPDSNSFYLGRQQKQPVQQVKLFPLSSKIIAHMCENVSFSPNNVNGRGGTNRRAKARRRAKNAIGRHRLGDRKSCLGDRKSCNAYSDRPNACPSPPSRAPFSGVFYRNFR